jgi:hypothetical protein
MTNQTNFPNSLYGSPAGVPASRLCALIFAIVTAAGPGVSGYAQDPPAANPAQAPATPPAPAKPAPPKPESTPASSDGQTMGGYKVHSMLDLGGRFAEKSGSRAMWATMVNQTTGARVLGQELRMHSIDPHKTPFADTLTTSSFGYGGDPYDASYVNMSKGKWYDFRGSFRRSRQYFDYNLLVNSLLGPNQLVAQPSSLHLFNTVRRNTDTLLTLFPVSAVSFRAGYNHTTHEGPTYSTIHQGGDVLESQWFRNATDTWVGGVDLKLSPQSIISYDQFLVFYKGDTNWQLAPAPYVYPLPDSTPATVGVNLLTTSTCGTKGTANYSAPIVNGVINPFCSGTTTQNETAPTRTSFPTEQLRFVGTYLDKLALNGRFLYSGGNSRVNSFNETFIGFSSRSLLRELIDTGALPHGHLANNKRINVNGDFSARAEITRRFEISDVFNYWDVRVPGETAWNEFSLKGVATQTGPPVKYGTSMLTPLNDPSLTPSTNLNTDAHYLAHKNAGNTILGTFTVTPQVKIIGGWRYNDRQIKVDDDDTLTWHQNWLLLGGVVQPSPVVRVTLNYDAMFSHSSNSSTTPANTYTREAPNMLQDFRARAQVKPAKWVNFAVSGIVYTAKNDDPQVNHKEHNNDFSFAAQFIPTESISVDFSFAHDWVYSVTDLCYTASPLPPGAATGGTCVNSVEGNSYLGNGYYNAPLTYVTGAFNYSAKYFHVDAGARWNDVGGSAEMLSPYQVPGSIDSTYLQPFADLTIHIARQWSWHGNWNRYKYNESGPFGPAARDFNGDVFTLGVKHEF